MDSKIKEEAWVRTIRKKIVETLKGSRIMAPA